jgi:PAS domain-containing protein
MRYRLIREDGEIVFVKSLATPIFDSKGKFRGHIGTLVDISDFLKTH